VENGSDEYDIAGIHAWRLKYSDGTKRAEGNLMTNVENWLNVNV
jgi:hypothetical protein